MLSISNNAVNPGGAARCSIHTNVMDTELGEAAPVLDTFRVVGLGVEVLDRVRR